MNAKRIAYIDDLTWISHQNVPREVKNYIKSLIVHAKQIKANNSTVRNNDATYSVVIKGDNFGGIGNNSKTTTFKQSEKRSSEESSQAVNKRQRYLEEREEEEEEEEKEENNDHDDDEDEKEGSGVLIEYNSLDGHKRKVYIYDYLNNVDKVWQPLKHWSLNNLDISIVLVLYRNRSIHLASLENNLTDNRVLSLSNVFVVGLEQENSCFHLFKKQYYEAVTKQYKAKQDYELLPFLARKWCSLFDEVVSSNVKF
ncbi:hypothetical protein BDC45DRAFT_299076 [Circinella umbellata]|nr:hypothetical protein BDC45DRAFT_299076 [Circinella umbellata]